MKIKKIIMSVFLLGILMCGVNVNAACAVGASVSDEFVCLVEGATGGNSSGTAYPENRILVLNNYNGSSISFSSGLGIPMNAHTIKLIGDNYITAEDSYGILMSFRGINFVGDGTLTIKSKLPFAIKDFDTQTSLYTLGDTVSVVKIVSGSKINDNTELSDDTETVDNNLEDIESEKHLILIL